tara:strand:+ start:2668 stop:3345 length:678 start_codon:yes stop_codon:yes gene_type:complete
MRNGTSQFLAIKQKIDDKYLRDYLMGNKVDLSQSDIDVAKKHLDSWGVAHSGANDFAVLYSVIFTLSIKMHSEQHNCAQTVLSIFREHRPMDAVLSHINHTDNATARFDNEGGMVYPAQMVNQMEVFNEDCTGDTRVKLLAKVERLSQYAASKQIDMPDIHEFEQELKQGQAIKLKLAIIRFMFLIPKYKARGLGGKHLDALENLSKAYLEKWEGGANKSIGRKR